MSIQRKLLLGFLGVILLTVALGGVTFIGVAHLQGSVQSQMTAAHDMTRLGDLAVAVKSLQELSHDYMATGHTETRTEFAEVKEQALPLFKEQSARAGTIEERVAWTALEDKLNALIALGEHTLVLPNPIGNPEGIGMLDAMDVLAGELDRAVTGVEEAVALRSEAAMERLLQGIIIGGTVLAAAMGLIIALLISRQISRPVRELAEAARRLAGGDLAQAFNQMVVSLRELIEQVSGSASRVAASAVQLQHTTGDVSRAAESARQVAGEIAGAAENLLEVAGNLQRQVSRFRLTKEAGKAV